MINIKESLYSVKKTQLENTIIVSEEANKEEVRVLFRDKAENGGGGVQIR